MKAPILNPPTGRSFHCVAEGYTVLASGADDRTKEKQGGDAMTVAAMELRSGCSRKIFPFSLRLPPALKSKDWINIQNGHPDVYFVHFLPWFLRWVLVSVSKHLDLDHLFRYEKAGGERVSGWEDGTWMVVVLFSLPYSNPEDK